MQSAHFNLTKTGHSVGWICKPPDN